MPESSRLLTLEEKRGMAQEEKEYESLKQAVEPA